MFICRCGERISRISKTILGQCGSVHRQFLCRTQFRRVRRRFVRLYSERSSLPDGVIQLFPHERPQYGAVRAHLDHCRRRCLCELSGGVHGSHPRRESTPCGHCRNHRVRPSGGQILHRAKLVSRRQNGAGGRVQFRYQTRPV